MKCRMPHRASVRRIRISKAGTDGELESAFAAFIEQRIEALLVCSDPFFDTRRDRIISFAAQSRIPAIYQFREYPWQVG